jgi:hypothetical protein
MNRTAVSRKQHRLATYAALEDTITRYIMKPIGDNPKKLCVMKNGAKLSLPSYSFSIF